MKGGRVREWGEGVTCVCVPREKVAGCQGAAVCVFVLKASIEFNRIYSLAFLVGMTDRRPHFVSKTEDRAHYSPS